MCGIVGHFVLNKKEANTLSIYQMNMAQGHRGPDDSGLCSIDLAEGKIEILPNRCMNISNPADGFMGFNRLSILDLTQSGHQPMLDSRRKVSLTFNGEIYNAFVFKDELEKTGWYHFKSRTDTEVLLALYLKYGIQEAVKKLNGMFAFSIFDMNEKRLYLVRDRFGIKPLYYSASDKGIIYASEIKSFIALEDFKPQLDINAFRECAIFGYCYGTTLLRNVAELKPGCILCYDMESRTYSVSQYFDLNHYSHPLNPLMGEKEAKRVLYKKLETAVKRQMVSDVKLGCQLSGGVDSSLTSYFARQQEKGNLDGISIIFDLKKYGSISEESYMDMVSHKLGINVHKAELTEEYFVSNLFSLIWHLDTIPKFYNEMGILLLSEEAKKYVTVLLSGEGSDELFCGYDWMCHSRFIEKEYGKNTMQNLWSRKIYRYGGGFKGRRETYENHMLFAADALPLEICRSLVSDYDNDEIYHSRKELLRSLTGSSFDRQVKYEMIVRLPALFNRQDKTTMARSIENRVPFLDNDLVDFAFELPEKYLIKRNPLEHSVQGKYLLKELCSDIFGKEFAYRKKSGFPVPILSFLKNEKFGKLFFSEILPKIRSRGLLNAGYVQNLYERIDKLTYWEGHSLFMAISLEIWIWLFIEKKKIAEICI